MWGHSSQSRRVNVAILLASVILGVMLTAQFRSTAARLPAREQSRLATTDTVRRLETEQRLLKERIAELRLAVAAYQRTAEPVVSAPIADVEQQRLRAGLIAMRGPGLVVVLDDSSKAVSPGEDANNYIIHDYELRDVISLLWLAGAEAIAVNNERLVNVSSVYCVGSTILVNDTRLSPPYEVRAIGDPAALEQAIQNPRNLVKLRSRVKTYGIELRVAPQKETTIPAYSGNLNIRYARPVSAP